MLEALKDAYAPDKVVSNRDALEITCKQCLLLQVRATSADHNRVLHVSRSPRLSLCS